jgi:hypothetical protein
MTRTRRIAATIALGLVATALFSSVAQAARPDDRAGMLGIGAIAVGSERESIRPDDRGTARGPGSLEILVRNGPAVRPDDRAGARGPGVLSGPATVSVGSAPSSYGESFAWAEFSMGAAVIVFLAGLLGTALVLNGRYHRRPA